MKTIKIIGIILLVLALGIGGFFTYSHFTSDEEETVVYMTPDEVKDAIHKALNEYSVNGDITALQILLAKTKGTIADLQEQLTESLSAIEEAQLLIELAQFTIDNFEIPDFGTKFTIVENEGLDMNSSYIVYCSVKIGSTWYSYSALFDFTRAQYRSNTNSYLLEATTYNTPSALGWNKIIFYVADGNFVADAGYQTGALPSEVMLVIKIG